MGVNMKRVVKKIYHFFLKLLPTKIVLNIENFRGYHKFINFKNPRYFGEKIQYLKLKGNLENLSDFVDKYEVRKFVDNKIKTNILIPLLGVYNNANEIKFDELPKSFVLKINNGSGFNIIVKDKEQIDRKKICKTLNKWLLIDYSKIKKEPQYKNVKRKIIIEKFITDNNDELLDYKFFCFNGKIEFIEVDFDRFDNHKMNFYDSNWNLLELKKGNYQNYTKKVNIPKNFNIMKEYAEKLSKDFNFVRVDLYNVNGKIYFGELTFTPASGLTPFKPIDRDLEIASKIKLPIKKNVMLLASTSNKKNRLDGVTIKSRELKKYLTNINEINLCCIDTDNYSKRFISIILKFIINYRKTNKIVICSSSPGASKILKFLRIINCKKEIYYFVAGGVIADKIEEGIYDIRNYKSIKKIFVESIYLKNQMSSLGLNNVEQMNNFRCISNFNNNYKKTSTIKFVYWGRVIKQKGIEQAIELIKKLKSKNYNVSLDIIGQCDDEYLLSLSDKFNSYIKYKGSIVPNGKLEYETLSKYDIKIFPTYYPNEGLPGAIIDSYIAGLAVIASNWKYAKEYINENQNGIIFEYKNYDDMYLKTKWMIDNKKIAEFKKESLKLSKKYDLNYVLKAFKKELIK